MTVAPSAWDEESQKLSEDVAQGQQVQEAQGMEPLLVLPMLSDLALNRFEVRQHVAVGDHNSLRFGSRSRREDDLKHVVAGDLRAGIAVCILLRDRSAQVFHDQHVSSSAK